MSGNGRSTAAAEEKKGVCDAAQPRVRAEAHPGQLRQHSSRANGSRAPSANVT